MSTEKIIHTYHCICTQLVLASTSPLESLTPRTVDSSLILPIITVPGPGSSNYAKLLNTVADSKPTVIRRDDGLEKRYMHKCGRCDLTLAYQLDKSQFEGAEPESGPRLDVVYVFPGGLMSTEDMKKGKDMDAEITKVGITAV